MVIINAVGLLCPVPVIETKKAIEKLAPEGGIVRVLVDNSIACENLDKMCQQKGHKCTVEKRADKNYEVTIIVGENHSVEKLVHTETKSSMNEGLVVAIGQDRMGSGNDDLGRILIKGFIYSLVNSDIPPKAIIFFNSGVKLALENANTLDDLKTLKQKGTAVLVCGTCVDFYNCKNQVAVGEITNMYNIVEVLKLAGSVINI